MYQKKKSYREGIMEEEKSLATQKKRYRMTGYRRNTGDKIDKYLAKEHLS